LGVGGDGCGVVLGTVEENGGLGALEGDGEGRL
jgi:hypothetical protein